MSKTIHVGLINGRHDMPVNDYIFDSVDDVFDYDDINRIVTNYIWDNCDVQKTNGKPINGTRDAEASVYKARNELVVYATGLSCVNAALVAACARYGVRLMLMHHDRDTGNYYAQRVF